MRDSINNATKELEKEGYQVLSEEEMYGGAYCILSVINSTGYADVYVYPDGQWHWDM